MAGALILYLLLAATPPETASRLPPVDACATDAGFAGFRASLLEAVARRDAAHLLAAVADDISVDFGGGRGRAYFAEAWDLDRPESSALWGELEAALRLGCAVSDDGSYWSPSLFLAPVIDDPFSTFLVVTPGAGLHAAPDPASPVVAALDWDLVQGIEWQEGDVWWRVRLADGREGYARAEDLRSPVDYRAGFQRIDGRWRMTAFIAGD